MACHDDSTMTAHYHGCFSTTVVIVNRDQLIERLRWEVSQLRRELARVKAEDQMVIESLHNRVHELEMELSDLRQIAESTTTVSLHSHALAFGMDCQCD